MKKILTVLLMTVLGVSTTLADTFKTTDDVTIDYEIAGVGETLVMLHSGMMSREDMRGQIDYFSDFYKVISIDAREQGRSTSSSEQISYQLMANDMIGVLDQLNIKKASLWGQSDGGVTALMVTHLYPERVEKLIIHGAVYNHSAYPASQKEGWKNVSWDKDSELDNDPEGFPGMAFEHYLLGRPDLTQFESHFQEMSMMWATSPNLSKDDLGNINVPTLVIVGDHYDISIPHTVEMHEALNNSELFIAPGATHFIHQEKPKLLHKIMHEFLR
jgi:pimeloyl-ACP methyl ester carboxylesterase